MKETSVAKSNRFSRDISSVSTLVEVLHLKALHQSDQVAYTFLVDGETEEVSLTYGELDQQARAIAARLQAMGVEGERALLMYPQGLEYITGFWGCLYAKVIGIPLYPPRIKQRILSRVEAIANDAEAKLVLTTVRNLSISKPAFAEVPKLKTLRFLATDSITEDMADSWRRPSIKEDTIAFFQYTSGSSANPKGVIVSHGNVLHNLASLHRNFNLTPDRIFVSWVPIFHDMGLIFGTLLPLYGGYRDILMSPVSFAQRPVRWLQAISNYRATSSGGSNFAYDLCVRKIHPKQRETLDLSSWTLAVNGSETVHAETLDRFVEAFGPCGFRRESFYPSYGLAEATLGVSCGYNTALPAVKSVNIDKAALERNHVVEVSAKEKNSRRIVACGQTYPDQKTIIVHPELFVECPPEQIGEIWISGPSVAQGYWKRPEETLQTFHAYLSDTDEGPFLRTGDLGFFREGELFITGRLKDLIIIRGRNLYPEDIELTVEQSHPALQQGCSAAFSVDIDGEERIVVVQEIKYGQQVDVDEVLGAIRQAVFEEHEVQVYTAVLIRSGSILKTSSGKIQRRACRNAFLVGNLNVWEVEKHSENKQHTNTI